MHYEPPHSEPLSRARGERGSLRTTGSLPIERPCVTARAGARSGGWGEGRTTPKQANHPHPPNVPRPQLQLKFKMNDRANPSRSPKRARSPTAHPPK
ncbi:hypothetical protein D3C71_1000390 [compost metagenome]